METHMFKRKDSISNGVTVQQSMISQLSKFRGRRECTQGVYKNLHKTYDQIIKQLLVVNSKLTAERQALLRENYNQRNKINQLQSIIQQLKGYKYDQPDQLIKQAILHSGNLFDICARMTLTAKNQSEMQQDIQRSCQSEEKESYLEQERNPSDGLLDSRLNNVKLVQGERAEERQEIQKIQINESYYKSQSDEQNQKKIGQIREQNSEISLGNLNRRAISVISEDDESNRFYGSVRALCSSSTYRSVIRAFYINILQFENLSTNLIELIQSLKNDDTYTIYGLYPTNEFWTDMLVTYIELLKQGNIHTNEVQFLNDINKHHLIDILLVNCIQSRIEFLDLQNNFNILQIFEALSNQFNIRLETSHSLFKFYSKEYKDSLLLEEQGSRISMNRRQEASIESQSPIFVINHNFQKEVFQFDFAMNFQEKRNRNEKSHRIVHRQSFQSQIGHFGRLNTIQRFEAQNGQKFDEMANIYNNKNNLSLIGNSFCGVRMVPKNQQFEQKIDNQIGYKGNYNYISRMKSCQSQNMNEKENYP